MALLALQVARGLVSVRRPAPRGRVSTRALPTDALSLTASKINLTRTRVLPSEAVVDAVARAGRRVTVADVASKGGLDLARAREGLVTLASALGSEAALEVSEDGELVFAFPGDVKGALAKASRVAAFREK